DLAPAAASTLAGRLGRDAEANEHLARDALCAAAKALTARTTVQDLKRQLLQLAADCSVVLDLHCDAQAVLHLYALTPQAPQALELAALLGARAVLLATESGDNPFDEACTRPWWLLQQRFAEQPLPLGCFAATVELRGQDDTDHAQAAQDADALLEFLRRSGMLHGTPVPLPPAPCEATLLTASEPIVAPRAGVVVFHHAPGDVVEAGATVADLVDLDSGALTPLRSQSAGVLYARIATRWASAGMTLAKVAGKTLERSGNLLGA
ncbi:MAG: succinylglutamate desuccinylase/aspartoacylase family protein, partial [Rubrivivax sp.]